MCVILLRHASAGDRAEWQGDDVVRPLDKRGHKQALALREALLARGVRRSVSSPYVRCVQTVEPLAAPAAIPAPRPICYRPLARTRSTTE